MSARDANLLAIEQVAERLGDLRDRVVFVVGSTAALFITSPVVHEVRATKDVDLVVEVARTAEYCAFADELRAKGFHEDSREGAPMCRWVVAAVTVDIVPARPDVFGPTNRWYASAIQ